MSRKWSAAKKKKEKKRKKLDGQRSQNSTFRQVTTLSSDYQNVLLLLKGLTPFFSRHLANLASENVL